MYEQCKLSFISILTKLTKLC